MTHIRVLPRVMSVFTGLVMALPASALLRAQPTIFVSLEEQLGLELRSTNGPLDVIVIDRIEQPVAD